LTLLIIVAESLSASTGKDCTYSLQTVKAVWLARPDTFCVACSYVNLASLTYGGSHSIR